MSYPTKVFQLRMVELLRAAFPAELPVEKEWRAIKNIPGLYCPRIDIVIGPFAEEGSLINQYDALMDSYRPFIEHLMDYHHENLRGWGDPRHGFRFQNYDQIKSMNKNSRCFLAIEIENCVSRKHLLGGAVNASALGRVGIVIGWTVEKIKALVRLREYWHFLGSVGKNTFDTSNILFLSQDQFESCIPYLSRDTNPIFR